MKKITVKLILSILLVGTSFSIGAYYYLFTAQAQSLSYELAGWLWSDNYGWVSLNSENDTSCVTGGCRDYSVAINNNQITGYSWSTNVGWICFGDTCSGSAPSGLKSAAVDPATGRISGWAKIISLDNNGWINLGGLTAPTAANNTTGEQCYNCQKACIQTDPESGACLAEELQCQFCFLKTCTGENTGGDDPTSRCALADQRPLGVGGDDPIAGGSGLVCPSGRQCAIVSLSTGQEIVTCGSYDTTKCNKTGVWADLSSGRIYGWLWNGNNDGLNPVPAGYPASAAHGVTGAGWLHFGGDAKIVYPWLETKYGSIFTPNDVRQRAGSARSNATYCIFADNITNVSSANCQAVVSDVTIDFPTGVEVYRNALGKIDISGLTTVVGNNRNKFGQIVVTALPTGEFSLGDKIYHIAGDLTINSILKFANAGLGGRGQGTIVVEGDVFINADVNYGSGGIPADLRQLASVAWIVKGDVIINANVQTVAGAFLVVGQDGVECVPSNSDPNFPRYNQNSCGVVFSGQTTTIDDPGLTVLGLFMARAFDFRRSYAKPDRGSELIIYDGRLIANPPPGFKSFSEGMPVIRDFTY